MREETVAVHSSRVALEPPGLSSPIYLSTTFQRDMADGRSTGYIYSRRDNPVRHALEECIAKLEGGVFCAAFSSGCAAIFAACMSLNSGDHIIAPKDAFFITRRILQDTFVRLGIFTVSWVDTADLGQIRSAITPRTRLIFIESPTNPLLRLVDIKSIASIAHTVGAKLVCDNTVATALFQRPLELGADFVVLSTTKYLTGHGDAMGGAVVWKVTDDLTENIKKVQGDWGGIPSPFDCWLTLRGIKTLPIRVREQSSTAVKIIEFLRSHSAVICIYYPGYDPINGGIKPFGGLVSFQVKGGEREAIQVMERVHLFTRATSFGGPESLIEIRATTEGNESALPKNLIRLSIGLENAQDLIEDLAAALRPIV